MQTQLQKQSTYGLASKTQENAKGHSRKKSTKKNPFGVQSTNSLHSVETENVFAAKSSSRTRKSGELSKTALSHVQNTLAAKD